MAAAGGSVEELRTSVPEVVALAMAVAAIVLFWCAVIHRASILAVEHAAMLPAMIAVMLLRRGEYSRPVRSHARM